MKWNKAAAGLLAGMMVMGLSVSAEETGAIVELTEVTAIAETLEDGQAVTCVMIEYPGEVAAGTVSLSSYKVPGRKISKVYVNNSGEKGEAEAQGKYVFVELSVDLTPGAGEGGTLLYANGENMRLPINLTIQQTANVTLASGDIVEAGSFTNTAEQNLLVDEFLELTYTNPEDGSELPYRLYIPEGYDKQADNSATYNVTETVDGKDTIVKKTGVVVPKLKFDTIDKILTECHAKGLKLRGHTLLWHEQTPTYFFQKGFSVVNNKSKNTSEENMDLRLEYFVKNVMEHILKKDLELAGGDKSKCVLYAYDVVNEYMHSGSPK